MSDPVRIWAKRTDDTIGMWSAHKPLTVPATEYVRADIVARVAGEAKALISATIKNGDTDDFEVYVARQDLKQALAAMEGA